jgi:hypothetical protein
MRRASRVIIATGSTALALCLGLGCRERPHHDHGDGDADNDAEFDDSGPDADLDADQAEAEEPLIDADIHEEGRIHDLRWRLHGSIRSIVYVSWSQDVAGPTFVRYQFDDDDWISAPTRELEAGDHEQIVIGIPYDRRFRLQIVVDAGSEEIVSTTIEGQTAELPSRMLAINLAVAVPGEWGQEGSFLLGSVSIAPGGWATSGGYWIFVIDRFARILWAYETPAMGDTKYVRLSQDGRSILWDHDMYWGAFQPEASTVSRMLLDGNIVQVYRTPGLHHPFTELPDGSIVWGASLGDGSESLEQLDPNGVQTSIWDVATFSQEIGTAGTAPFSSNSLFYDASRDTFLFSTYSGSYIVEIDRATGRSIRVFEGGFASPVSWTVDPQEYLFSWQHGVTYTSEGHLLLSCHATPFPQMAIEYELDEGTQTLRPVWSFGRNDGVMAGTAGEAHRLVSGNTLINYGDTPTIREVAPDGTIVWEVQWESGHFIGRTVLLDDLYDLVPEQH